MTIPNLKNISLRFRAGRVFGGNIITVLNIYFLLLKCNDQFTNYLCTHTEFDICYDITICISALRDITNDD